MRRKSDCKETAADVVTSEKVVSENKDRKMSELSDFNLETGSISREVRNQNKKRTFPGWNLGGSLQRIGYHKVNRYIFSRVVYGRWNVIECQFFSTNNAVEASARAKETNQYKTVCKKSNRVAHHMGYVCHLL